MAVHVAQASACTPSGQTEVVDPGRAWMRAGQGGQGVAPSSRRGLEDWTGLGGEWPSRAKRSKAVNRPSQH